MVAAQDTDVNAVPDPTRAGADQPAGERYTTAWPVLSTATQNVAPTHDTPTMLAGPVCELALSTIWGDVHVLPFHARTLPLLSPVRQNDELAHDTDSSAPWVSWSCGCDQDEPFHMAVPPPSVATQKLGSVHDEPVGPPHAPDVPDQRDPLNLNASPSPSTDVQKVGVAQASDCRRAGAGTGNGEPHDVPFQTADCGLPTVAMQKLWLAHDTYALPATGVPRPSGWAADQKPAKSYALPASSITTQNWGVGHADASS